MLRTEQTGSEYVMSPGALAPALLPLIDRTVYGPIRSRRLGWSLGVNLLPPDAKVCSFNCIYCQYGWTTRTRVPSELWPSPDRVIDAVCRALAATATGRLDAITLAGHGEPTLHPGFPAIARSLVEVRDRAAPGTKLALLTNGTRLHEPRVREAALALDECCVKFDAGDQATLRRVNATAFALSRLMTSIRAMRSVTLQSMFVHDPLGLCGNSSIAAQHAWLERVTELRPAAVHLYTLARNPACRRLEPVGSSVLDALAASLRRAGITAIVFA
jgi:wyosine [tRNA(Phe)-imidazoG37] synthetase (radical SAM superfamily)